MQPLTLFMIVAVTLFPYLSNGDSWKRMRVLPGFAAFAPEALGALALLIVIALGTRNRFRYVRPAYWLTFAALFFVLACSAIVNGVDSGPLIAGARLYLRAVPWFFIPAVFAFTPAHIRTQLRVLAAVCLLQVPIAIEQRIKTEDPQMGFSAITGDWTTGTLGDSGVLSIFLVAAACVAVALYEKRQLRLLPFIALFALILVPTTINETKATIIFLPLGLLMAVFYGSDPAKRFRRLGIGVGLLVLFGSIFVPVYDKMNEKREYSSKLSEFFLNENNLKSYVSANAAGGEGEAPGRADAIAVPLRNLSKDPVSLAFGYGPGNASESSMGPNFAGKYAIQYHVYMQSAMARFILEMGLFGIVLLLLLYWLIFQDCRTVATMDQPLIAGLGAGWAGVLVVVTIAMLYVLLEAYPAASFLFWYFSGLVAAARMRGLAIAGQPA